LHHDRSPFLITWSFLMPTFPLNWAPLPIISNRRINLYFAKSSLYNNVDCFSPHEAVAVSIIQEKTEVFASVISQLGNFLRITVIPRLDRGIQGSVNRLDCPIKSGNDNFCLDLFAKSRMLQQPPMRDCEVGSAQNRASSAQGRSKPSLFGTMTVAQGCHCEACPEERGN
jgi:hypothetical protein